jgi:hypothetical protein
MLAGMMLATAAWSLSFQPLRTLLAPRTIPLSQLGLGGQPVGDLVVVPALALLPPRLRRLPDLLRLDPRLGQIVQLWIPCLRRTRPHEPPRGGPYLEITGCEPVLELAHEGDQIGLLLGGQPEPQDQVEELHRVLERE